MTIRSMTGFAQVRGQVNAQLAFSLSLKSVNHRFLDLHFRLPSDTDALEMRLRRILKEKLARGHVEVILNLDRSGPNGVALNRQMIAGYVAAFRTAAGGFGVDGAPAWRVWRKRRLRWTPIAVRFCAVTRSVCNRACWRYSARWWTKSGFCRKWRCSSIAATSRKNWCG